MPVDLRKPVLLHADNFMPLTRTPWAGSVITTCYKDEVVPEARGRMVGESWEFSCDPAYPSRIDGHDVTLPELVDAHPHEIFGEEEVGPNRIVNCEILVKMIDAAQPLSLQIHPTDDDQDLKPGTCGKPESWYVLRAQQGAGIYLGFNRSLKIQELRDLLLKEDAAKDVLQFVPVQPGDYFEISPGVPHAIGAGVTILEPQRLKAGSSGMTFRMWDWGRKYASNGTLDLNAGLPRELHLEQSLKLVNPERQFGPQFVDVCRRMPTHKRLKGSKWTSFPENAYYQLHLVDTIEGDHLTLQLARGYGALVVLSGSMAACGVNLSKGRSALLPSNCFPLERVQLSPDTKLAIVVPAHAEFKVIELMRS